jgi:hypothetical protein
MFVNVSLENGELPVTKPLSSGCSQEARFEWAHPASSYDQGVAALLA